MQLNKKETGFSFVDENLIEFYCEPKSFTNYSKDLEIYISGSFNGWINSQNADWKLERKINKNKEYFVLQKTINSVMIPGNTGFPEFQFYGLTSTEYIRLEDCKEAKKYSFNFNRLIFKDKTDLEQIDYLNNHLIFKKSLNDFDLNCPACRADISNVRIVPGTKCLFRGYNPFKKSKTQIETEDKRIELTQKAYELYKIKSDITLNGSEGAVASMGETLPDFIKNMEKKGNRLCINIDYNLVYFHPDAVDFTCALRTIGIFITEHPAPYFIHCRLGSDRTGVVCAIFAALCGAKWKEIAYDYERTSNVGMEEYRNRKLLQYSLKKMLGKDPANVKDLAHLMQSYFIKEEILTMEQIKIVIKKLNEEVKSKVDYFDLNENHICAKKNAKI